MRTAGILWGISSGDFSQFFGIRHRVESGSEGRDRLGHHGLNVFDTSRVERHRALLPGRGKELHEASSYAWRTPNSAASLFPRVPGSQQTHKRKVLLKQRLEEWSTNWTSSLMQLASKFCHRAIPIYLRHSAPCFNQGLGTLTPQVSQLQVKGRHSSVWS